MKHLKSPLYFLLLIAATFAACKKDDKKIEASSTVASGRLDAKLYGFDGKDAGKFSSVKTGMIQVSGNGLGSFGLTAIRDGGNESINIVILKKITEVGKIFFGPDLTNGVITISKDYTKPADKDLNYTTTLSSANNVKGGGEVNITKIDGNKIEGTFWAVAYNAAGKEAFVEQGTFSGTMVQQ